MRVRLATADDIAAIIALECQSPSAAHWPRSQYENIFVRIDSHGSERAAWVVESEPSAPKKDPPVLCAFLIAHRVDAEWELENIVVAAAGRRQGIGSRLLAELVAHVRAVHGAIIFLEVRESNRSARALYQKAGFEETGLRKRYYANPEEDAILCRLRIG